MGGKPAPRVRQWFNGLVGRGKTAERAKERITHLQQGNGHLTLERLVEALDHPDPEARRDAVRTLPLLRDRRAVRPLIRALDDPSDEVCLAAIRALAKLGDPRAINALIPLLDVPALAVTAHEALRWLGYDPVRAERTSYSTQSNHKPVNSNYGAVHRPPTAPPRGEADMRDDRELESLIAALRNSDSVERARAAKALGKRGDWRAVEPLINALLESNDHATSTERAMEELGEPAVEQLISSLQDADASVRVLAVMALAKLGDSRTAEPLVAALRDTDELVQMAVWAALVDMGRPAVGPLMAALRDANPDVQRNAALALGELADPQSVDALLEALADPRHPARAAVTKALGQIKDPRSVEALIWALKDDDVTVRRRAATALGQIGDVKAIGPLVEAIERDFDHIVVHSAIIALNLIARARADDALNRLISDLNQVNIKVRASATVALGWLGDQRAIRPLLAALNKTTEPYLQGLIVEALRKLQQPSDNNHQTI
jgi:HEAT repeat protein